MKRITILVALILVLFSLTACGTHFHKWKAATCAEPKTCTGCGETQGEPLAHKVPEDGICTLCKRKLRNILTLEDKARPAAPTVFGGVILRMYLYSDSSGTMFPGSYTLYAEDGTQIADGDWGKIRPVTTGPHSSSRPEFVETEYFPLQQGNYRVEFTYYKKYRYDDEVLKYFVPDSDPIFVDYKFTVK